MKKLFILTLCVLFFSCGNSVDDIIEDESATTVVDIDGNVYEIATIGAQVWMTENLRTTKYRDGGEILNVKSGWGTTATGAYCDYDNTPSNSVKYGRLYNGYAVTNARNIAPEGWRIPTDVDWEVLIKYVGGESVAVNELKKAPFLALPAGNIQGSSFSERGSLGNWFTFFSPGNTNLYRTVFFFNDGNIIKHDARKEDGYSIRLIKEF